MSMLVEQGGALRLEVEYVEGGVGESALGHETHFFFVGQFDEDDPVVSETFTALAASRE